MKSNLGLKEKAAEKAGSQQIYPCPIQSIQSFCCCLFSYTYIGSRSLCAAICLSLNPCFFSKMLFGLKYMMLMLSLKHLFNQTKTLHPFICTQPLKDIFI